MTVSYIYFVNTSCELEPTKDDVHHENHRHYDHLATQVTHSSVIESRESASSEIIDSGQKSAILMFQH